MTEDAHLFPLGVDDFCNLLGQSPAGAAGIGPMAGNWTSPNPPFGAVFTFNLRQDPSSGAKLVVTITDDTGKQIRRFDVANGTGLRRVAWNLRADAPPPEAGRGGAGRVGGAGEAGGGLGPRQARVRT